MRRAPRNGGRPLTNAGRRPGAAMPASRRGPVAWFVVVLAATFVLAGAGSAGAAETDRAGLAVPVGAEPQRHQSLELYALGLVNCTRTGGWVLRNGACRGYGSGRFS